MINKKSIDTNTVQEMYIHYPFPDIDYQVDYGLSILRFLTNLKKRRQDFWGNAKVLEAGCGTGNTLNQLAKHFQSAHFLGVDFSSKSLEKAEKKRAEIGLNNIEFRNVNILDMNLEEKSFDVVLCIGVLHHLADMQEGLKRLVDHLAEDGIILLWLYGKYGRFRLNLNQRFFSILLQNHEKLEDKIDIVKKVLTKASEKHVACHFNVPYTEIEDVFLKSLEFIVDHPQWLVDQFLHANEIVLDMEDILKLISTANLRLLEWLNVNQNITAYINDADVAKPFSELNKSDKLLCLDLLLKPNYYTIALEKNR